MRRIRLDQEVAKFRRGFEARMKLLPSAAGVDISSESIDGVDCEWHVPQGCDDAPVIFFLHGGAYLVGSPATHRRLLSHIAKMSGMRAILPDYRLAPEHRFPAQLEDSLTVWRALLKGGLEPADLAISGDSAGGNLAVATMLALRDSGEPLPASCFLLSPWLDLSGNGDSHRSRAASDPWFRPEQMSVVASRFCDVAEFRKPLVSPVYADAADLPPTLIQVGDDEILLSDSTRFADNIKSAGGRVDLHIWPRMWHVFQYFIGMMPESRKAIDEVVRFLRSEHATDRVGQTKSRAA